MDESNTNLRDDPTPDQFDLFDHEVQSNPYPFYHAMQAHCPVYRLPQNGFYLISDYADLRAVLMDHETFSNQVLRHSVLQKGDNSKIFADILRERGWEPYLALQRADPPEHRKYRKIIDRVLNAKHALSVVPRMQQLAKELIDRFIDKGECDFVEEFALPFPGTIIAEQIGLDASEVGTFKKWADNGLSLFSRLLSADEMRAAAEIELEMQHYLVGVFEARKKEPKNDIISYLVNTVDGEEPLTMQEMQAVMNQVVIGGYETVISAFCHGMWTLIRFPDVTAELRTDRSLIPNFINESLRWESPTQGLFRVTKKDVELGGTHIPAGSVCLARYGAANRDPAMFPDPDRFDLHRENSNSHLAFGTGIHFCPGSTFARHEMSVAWNAILDRMDNLELAKPLPYPVHKPNMQLFPMRELFVKFTKRG